MRVPGLASGTENEGRGQVGLSDKDVADQEIGWKIAVRLAVLAETLFTNKVTGQPIEMAEMLIESVLRRIFRFIEMSLPDSDGSIANAAQSLAPSRLNWRDCALPLVPYK